MAGPGSKRAPQLLLVYCDIYRGISFVPRRSRLLRPSEVVSFNPDATKPASKEKHETATRLRKCGYLVGCGSISGSSVFSSILLCHLSKSKQSEENFSLAQEPDLGSACTCPPHKRPKQPKSSTPAGGEGAGVATIKALWRVSSCTSRSYQDGLFSCSLKNVSVTKATWALKVRWLLRSPFWWAAPLAPVDDGP